MSYILDALRKADAQRERDPARGIHAQSARAAIGDRPQRAGRMPWVWAGAAAAVAVIAVGGWYVLRDAPTPGPTAVAAVQEPSPTVIAPPLAAPPVAQPVVAQAVMPPPVIVEPPVVAPPISSAPAGSSPQSAPVPNRAERMRGSPPIPGSAPPAPSPGMASPSGAASSGPAQSVAPAPTAVPAPLPPGAAPPAAAPAAPVAGLPPDAPKLTITGGVYSASKAQRMLIVNGTVVAEGADLGSGVTLEEIKPKTAVLRFRGARYTVGY
jgi:general secretion pathway protein B